MNNNYLLILLGIILVAVEIIIGAASGFDLLLIGIIFIVSGFFGLMLNSFSLSLILITGLSVFYMIAGRKLIKNKLSVDTQKTNVDNLMGKKGIVLKKISKENPGQIKIEGEVWRAQADNSIEKGTEVSVKSVSGVTLKVE